MYSQDRSTFFCCSQIDRPIVGIYTIAHIYMNVETGTEAAQQFPFWDIFSNFRSSIFAVHESLFASVSKLVCFTPSFGLPAVSASNLGGWGGEGCISVHFLLTYSLSWFSSSTSEKKWYYILCLRLNKHNLESILPTRN